MQKLDISAIQIALFENPTVRSRIARDYSLPGGTSTPGEFCDAVIRSLRQVPSPDPLAQGLTGNQVFEAAVRAIGSNSRSWARFIGAEPELCRLFLDYDPDRLSVNDYSRAAIQEQIGPLLGGITARSDARAMMGWIEVLSTTPGYYDRIVSLANTARKVATSLADSPCPDAELMILLVAALAKPSFVRNASIRAALQGFAQDPKLRGMGYALGAEFFRNLGWSGFKPDRHIKRLLDRWRPESALAVERRVQALAAVFGTTDREFHSFARYSLIGIGLTPDDCTYSRADNLVWLLGAYVERKNRETQRRYIN